jgi:CDGSH-type Zn-finger protein
MAETRVIVQKNGPLRLQGEGLEILDPEGKPYGLGGRTVVSLCRCGHSNTKPFCDGSHNHHGFQDDPHARDLPPRGPAPPAQTS